MKNYHLIPTPEGWEVSREKASSPLGIYHTKKQAMAACAALLNEREGSLKIHKKDGSIQEERTYPQAADPAVTAG